MPVGIGPDWELEPLGRRTPREGGSCGKKGLSKDKIGAPMPQDVLGREPRKPTGGREKSQMKSAKKKNGQGGGRKGTFVSPERAGSNK